MSAPRPLVLVGPTGAGKSSVGRALARHLDRAFIDTDARIESTCGRTVAEVFARDGEAVFREHEHRALEQALAEGDCVIATGAGLVLEARNRAALACADVVHLHADVPTQLARLQGDTARPLLARPDREAVLVAMARARGPLYAEVAARRVDTDGRDVPAVVAAVIDTLERRPWT